MGRAGGQHRHSSPGTQQTCRCKKLLKSQRTAEAASTMRGTSTGPFSTDTINNTFTVDCTEYSPPDTYTPYKRKK